MAAALALISLGGALYKAAVVDPAWPRRPDTIQPGRGGVSRRRFWIPAHVGFEPAGFELARIAALLLTCVVDWAVDWPTSAVRVWLLIALVSRAAMRLWSAFDFIPKALAFERADAVHEGAARAWTRRSRLRIVLDVVTCGAMVMAVVEMVRVG